MPRSGEGPEGKSPARGIGPGSLPNPRKGASEGVVPRAIEKIAFKPVSRNATLRGEVPERVRI
jgi:hypothetical protein